MDERICLNDPEFSLKDSPEQKEKRLTVVKKKAPSKSQVPFKKKFWRFWSNVLDRIMLIFCLLFLFLGSYALIDTYNVYYHAQDKSVLKYKPRLLEDGTVESPQETISGNVAWITIPDTKIDYPIMQGEDNTEYLNKAPDGSFELSGSIFLDSRNASDFSDPYSLVYGHHMENGIMFGALDSFLEENFFHAHQAGTLIVGDKAYTLTFFASKTESARDQFLFNPENTAYADAMREIQNGAGVFDSSVSTEGKRILALSTCKADLSDDRTMVFAVIEE